MNIERGLKEAAGSLALGVIQGAVKVTSHEPVLWSEIDACLEGLPGRVTLEDVAKLGEIRGVREAYKALGKEPGRYRSSSEALVRRVLQGKGLYRVNTVVDLGNLVSLETFHPVCAFDLAKIKPPVTFTIGKARQTYAGIGKGEINIAELPVFLDEEGPFGSPTSDSRRTMITENTDSLLFIILSFAGRRALEHGLRRARSLLESYAAARDLESAVIT